MGLALFVIAVVQFIRDPANLINDFITDEPDNPSYDCKHKDAEHDLTVACAIAPAG